MRSPKYHLYLTPGERRTVINSLIDLRNEFIKAHESKSQKNQSQGGLNYGYKDYIHTAG